LYFTVKVTLAKTILPSPGTGRYSISLSSLYWPSHRSVLGSPSPLFWVSSSQFTIKYTTCLSPVLAHSCFVDQVRMMHFPGNVHGNLQLPWFLHDYKNALQSKIPRYSYHPFKKSISSMHYKIKRNRDISAVTEAGYEMDGWGSNPSRDNNLSLLHSIQTACGSPGLLFNGHQRISPCC
jgi:hypothetical protein